MLSMRTLSGPSRIIRALSTAYTYKAPGSPAAVLSREQLPISQPRATHLDVQWLAAGVDPVDLAAIGGDPSAKAFAPSSLPGVPGSEGVGRVTAIGSDVTGIAEGDLVIPIKTSVGTWRKRGVLDFRHVVAVRKDIRVELAATLSASPFTAYRLLRDFVSLSPGDVIMQNAASSPVGTAIVQLAKAMGVQSISVVKTNSGDYSATVERLKLMGGDVVIGEAYVNTEGLKQVMNDMPKPRLVINGGDKSCCSLLASLGCEDSAMVTYCPGIADTAALKSKKMGNLSFSLGKWLEQADRTEVEAMVTELTNMISEGELTAWLQRVKFDDLPAAIQQGGMTNRKLVAIMDDRL